MNVLFYGSCKLLLCFLLSNYYPITAWNLPKDVLLDRRSVTNTIVTAATAIGTTSLWPPVASATTPPSPLLQVVTDPNTYSALAYYAPPPHYFSTPPPLILVLHGAGRNDQDTMSDLGNPQGEHAGLIPSLIASGQAPPELLQHFAVLAPYSYGKASFYQDSRRTLLDFLDWAIANQNTSDIRGRNNLSMRFRTL
jgi:hypothetical protein